MNEKKNPHVLVIILVLIIMILSGIIGFMLYEKSKEKEHSTPTTDCIEDKETASMSEEEALEIGTKMYKSAYEVFSQSFMMEHGLDTDKCLGDVVKPTTICKDNSGCYEVPKSCYDKLIESATNVLSGNALKVFNNYVSQKYEIGSTIYMKECAQTCNAGDSSPKIEVLNISDNIIVFLAKTADHSEIPIEETNKTLEDIFVIKKDTTKSNGWVVTNIYYHGN